MIPAHPPASKKAPDAAHTELVSIPWGVISLKHWSGLAASGIMKPNYDRSATTPEGLHLRLI